MLALLSCNCYTAKTKLPMYEPNHCSQLPLTDFLKSAPTPKQLFPTARVIIPRTGVSSHTCQVWTLDPNLLLKKLKGLLYDLKFCILLTQTKSNNKSIIFLRSKKLHCVKNHKISVLQPTVKLRFEIICQ